MRRAMIGLSSLLGIMGGAAAMPLTPPGGASWIAPAAACGYGRYRGMDGACHKNGYVHTNPHAPAYRRTCFWSVGKQICH